MAYEVGDRTCKDPLLRWRIVFHFRLLSLVDEGLGRMVVTIKFDFDGVFKWYHVRW